MNTKPMMLVMLCLGVMGCESGPNVQREIRSARTRALRQWKQRQEVDDREGTRISGQLSLENALKLALTHNKSLQAVIQERDVARGRVMAAHNGLLPTISLLGGYTRYDDDAYDKDAMGSLDEYGVGLKVTQPLFRGGATQAEVRSARLLACYSDEHIRQRTETTLYDVTSCYYRVLLAQQLQEVARDAVTSAEAYQDEVTRKRDLGSATEYKVLRARVDVALYQAQLIQQRNALNLARTQLLKQMGVEQDSLVELSGDLVFRPVKTLFDQAVETAYHHRPDLGQAQANVRLGQEAIRLAASRYWPQVSAFATSGWSRPDPYQSTVDDGDTYTTVGVSGQWPLFDGLGREGRVVESKALLRQREFELLETQEQAILEIRQSLLSLRDAEQFVESQRMNLQLANEGLRLAEVGYTNGINTEIDVTDARSALTRAKGLHYQAVYDHAIARLKLQKACGILTDGGSNS